MYIEEPPEHFRPDPNQPRKCFPQNVIQRLADSLLTLGQQQPITATPDRIIISGQQRWLAAKLAGLKLLKAIIVDATEAKNRIAQLAENVAREGLKPIEVVDGVEEAAALNPGLTGKQLADMIGISPPELSKARAVAADPVARAALADGRLNGISEAYLVAKAEPDEKARLLTLRESGATRDDLTRKARTPRRQGEKVTRLAISLPGGVSVTLAGKEMDLEQTIEHLAECIKAARKARDEGLSAKSWAQGMRDKAGKS
jgi:ParB family transcriptional regulator, chromosome partitioning protein